MLQADVVLDCGATETAGGVEAVQILVDAVTQVFVILALKWTFWADHAWLRFANGLWGRALVKSLVADSIGMDQHLHCGSRKRARSCLYELA